MHSSVDGKRPLATSAATTTLIDGADEPGSGSGTWEIQPDGDGATVQVSFRDAGKDSWYTALRNGRTLKLWTYVGDPDEGKPLCVLAAPAG